MIDCLVKEIELRSSYLDNKHLETIYLGGGTPSILTIEDLSSLLDRISIDFDISNLKEFTIEANPDDINKRLLQDWSSLGIDRISLGVQSFSEEDLTYMNRSHSAVQSEQSIELILDSDIDSFSIDLIFGSHTTTNKIWKENLQKAIDYKVDHISAYGLTVEKNTALYNFITKKKMAPLDDKKASEQFLLTMQKLETAGYEHYEISNYGKKNKHAIHNKNYWEGKNYLGIGPGAHSYNGKTRAWNIAHNPQYIDAINKGHLAYEEEILTRKDIINEWLMIGLRTETGINIATAPNANETEKSYLQSIADEKLKQDQLVLKNRCYKLSRAGKLLADQIISDFFLV